MYHQPAARNTTPPSNRGQSFFPTSSDSHNTDLSFFASTGRSPQSLHSGISTPPSEESPGVTTLRHHGPLLLPRIRCQDQTREPSAGPIRHHRTVSASPATFQFSPYPYSTQRQTMIRPRTRSPEVRDLNSPASTSYDSAAYTAISIFPDSTASAFERPPAISFSSRSNLSSATATRCGEMGLSIGLTSPISFDQSHSAEVSRRSSLAHVRTVSLPVVPRVGHSRSVSASSVDDAVIWRHGYPAEYCQIPPYITAAPVMSSISAMTPPPMQTSLSASSAYMTPQEPTMSFDEEYNFNAFPEELDTFAQDSNIFSNEPNMVSQSTTSLMAYMSSQNPAPALIARSVTGAFNKKTGRDWWWWDVRTLRSWTDFDIGSILAVPGFRQTLDGPIYSAALPMPTLACSPPDTEHSLRSIYRDFFATKVNAAMKFELGDSQFFMQAVNSVSNNPWPKPDFISNYSTDYMQTQHGEQRGRLVGLVMSYQQWNTAMRSEDPTRQVSYLHGLSHLHRVMREHGCRYGFIITEIELLCVRAGANDADYQPCSNPNIPDEGPTPWFGFLETAPPVSLSIHGPDPETEAPRITASLALWYLHMLAMKEPLPGQPDWKIGVGGPAARTRQYCLERDPWMPRFTQHETRPAKNCRGWVLPADPFHKKENAKNNRRR